MCMICNLYFDITRLTWLVHTTVAILFKVPKWGLRRRGLPQRKRLRCWLQHSWRLNGMADTAAHFRSTMTNGADRGTKALCKFSLTSAVSLSMFLSPRVKINMCCQHEHMYHGANNTNSKHRHTGHNPAWCSTYIPRAATLLCFRWCWAESCRWCSSSYRTLSSWHRILSRHELCRRRHIRRRSR
jgi:hypothetical protein